MGQTVRAVYEQGQLRLLDKVTLSEGQEVSVTITSDRDRLRAALGDLVMKYPELQSDDDEIDEEALLRAIQAELTTDLRLSDAIIEERRDGP